MGCPPTGQLKLIDFIAVHPLIFLAQLAPRGRVPRIAHVVGLVCLLPQEIDLDIAFAV